MFYYKFLLKGAKPRVYNIARKFLENRGLTHDMSASYKTSMTKHQVERVISELKQCHPDFRKHLVNESISPIANESTFPDELTYMDVEDLEVINETIVEGIASDDI